MLGSAIAPVALAFAVLDDLGGSPSELGLVLAAASLPTVVFLLVAGVWADRLPRNQVMVAADLAEFAAQAGIAALLLTGVAELWHLVVLSALRGIGLAFFFPAASGVVPETVSPDRLQQANAALRISNSASLILGSALGGVLVVGVGPGWALAFDALTFLASATLLSRLGLAPPARPQTENFLRDLREGWREFRSRTWLWVIVVEFAFVNAFVSGSFQVLGPLVAKTSLGGADAWGLVLTAQAIGLVLGGLVALRYRPERPLLVASLAIALEAPLLALLAEEAALAAVVLGAALAGVGIELFTVLWDTTLQGHVPGDKLSRVAAYDWFGSLALAPLGLAVVGPVADAVGVAETLWGAFALLVGATAAVIAVADVRNLRRRPPQPAGAMATS